MGSCVTGDSPASHAVDRRFQRAEDGGVQTKRLEQLTALVRVG